MELMDIFSSVQDLATLYYYALFLGLAITRKQYLWLLGAILTAHGMSMLYFAVLGQSHNPFSFTWIPQFYLLVNGLLFYTHRIDWLNKDGIVAGDSFNAAIKKSWAARARKEKPLAAFAISMILQHLAFLAIYLLVWLLDLPHALGDRAEFARASHEAFFYIVYTMYPMYWVIGHVTGMATIWMLFRGGPKRAPALRRVDAAMVFGIYMVVFAAIYAYLRTSPPRMW